MTTTLRQLAIRTLALLPLLVVGAQVLVLSARPLATADTWYYLKMGELYVSEGPLSQTEPMLFTQGDVEPTPHEWLSEVSFYLVQNTFGFQGLRVFHAVLVTLALVLAWRLARRAGGSLGIATGVTAVWAVLSLQRLYQTRADLFSIVCALLVYGWVLERPESQRRSGLILALATLVFWVNAHSLFLIGFALTGAAGLGVLLMRAHAKEAGGDLTSAGRGLRPLLLFAGLGVLVTAINPRGFAQHLTFFSSSSEHEIWGVQDDWHAFSLWSPGPPDNSPMLSPLAWLLGVVTLVALIVAAVAAVRRARPMRPSEAAETLDLPQLMIGIASIAAYLISFRFLWLAIFPWLYVARVLGQSAPRPASIGGPILAGLLALAVPAYAHWSLLMFDVPKDAGTYLRTDVNRASFADEGLRFLKEASLSGRMYNNYTIGAYLGYHLAPAIRTFVDGRTEHYPVQVDIDYGVIEGGGLRESDGRPFLAILEDYGVDLFFGVGGPGYAYTASPTLRHLEGVPWWTLVYRSAGFAIYLRANERNAENLNRVAEYWGALGVPFDRTRGLMVGAAIQKSPDWAVHERLLPPEGPELLRDAENPDPHRRYPALRKLGPLLFVAGDYLGAIEASRGALQLRPDVGEALLPAIDALIALGRFDEARTAIEEAVRLGIPPVRLTPLSEGLVAAEGFRASLPSYDAFGLVAPRASRVAP